MLNVMVSKNAAFIALILLRKEDVDKMHKREGERVTIPWFWG